MTAIAAILTAIILAGGALTQLEALWKAAKSVGRTIARAGRAIGRVAVALGRNLLAYLKMPAHVATIAKQLVAVGSDAQEALDEWKGSSQFMASTVLDHEHQLEQQEAKLEDHDTRIHRLEELAGAGRLGPALNPRYQQPPATA